VAIAECDYVTRLDGDTDKSLDNSSGDSRMYRRVCVRLVIAGAVR